jgi:hypothetical protein
MTPSIKHHNSFTMTSEKKEEEVTTQAMIGFSKQSGLLEILSLHPLVFLVVSDQDLAQQPWYWHY